jgi:hypothetical protein
LHSEICKVELKHCKKWSQNIKTNENKNNKILWINVKYQNGWKMINIFIRDKNIN